MSDISNDFKTLPFSIIYSFDKTKEQLDTLNTLIQDCLKKRTLLRKVKFTRPPWPWLKKPRYI